MANKVFLMGLRIVVVNRATKREWAQSLNAEGVLCAQDSEVKEKGSNYHRGRTTVMVEGLPFPIEYSVKYSEYEDGMSVTTSVMSPDNTEVPPKWLIKLTPLFEISWEDVYPIGI